MLTEAIEIQVTAKTISIDRALRQRAENQRGDYRCPKCGQSVIAFKKNNKGGRPILNIIRARSVQSNSGQRCEPLLFGGQIRDNR